MCEIALGLLPRAFWSSSINFYNSDSKATFFYPLFRLCTNLVAWTGKCNVQLCNFMRHSFSLVSFSQERSRRVSLVLESFFALQPVQHCTTVVHLSLLRLVAFLCPYRKIKAQWVQSRGSESSTIMPTSPQPIRSKRTQFSVQHSLHANKNQKYKPDKEICSLADRLLSVILQQVEVVFCQLKWNSWND